MTLGVNGMGVGDEVVVTVGGEVRLGVGVRVYVGTAVIGTAVAKSTAPRVGGEVAACMDTVTGAGWQAHTIITTHNRLDKTENRRM